jgi:hypothetical protein
MPQLSRAKASFLDPVEVLLHGSALGVGGGAVAWIDEKVAANAALSEFI